MRSTTICTALAAMVSIAPLVSAEVREGDVAPLHRLVDDKMRAIDIVVPAAARLAGANGTRWASDLLLHNTRTHTVQASVRR